MDNYSLVGFCKSKLGVPYVMGTNGKIMTNAMLDDLIKRNPSKWFTEKRKQAVRSWIGRETTDCHGLIEWYIRDVHKKNYDTSADAAYQSALEKGSIKTMPEIVGLCVRYPGHVGVYAGSGKVIEARGFDYGVCITDLSKRPWTHWYKHPMIDYGNKGETTMIKCGMKTKDIQNELNKAGYIECENGVYDISEPLILKSNTRLNLNNAVFRQGAPIHFIFITDTEKDTVGFDGASNIEIYNGTIEGMGKYNTKLNLLTTYHAKNIYIHDIKFVDVVGFHHLEINSSSCVVVEKCKFNGYNVIDSENFRECIQIDSATKSSLVIHDDGKCHDGTSCENVTIRCCEFGKSESRIAPANCIGNHCQSESSHKNIIISNNKFIGDIENNPSGVCISLVGMKNVTVSNNEISGFGRGVRVYSYPETYENDGKKRKAAGNDGVCVNVEIVNNSINQNGKSKFSSNGIRVSGKNGMHKGIYVHGNDIQTENGKIPLDISNAIYICK